MRERKADRGQERESATADDTERDPRREHAMHKRQKERRGARVVEAGADEMVALDVSAEEVQAIRDRLIDRVDDAHDKGELALHRFESILRAREAEPALEKGFGETAKATAIDWFADKLKEGFGAVLEAAEIPLAPAKAGVGLAREAIEGEIEAKKAGSKLKIVDELVSSTHRALVQATTAAKAAIRAAQPMDLFKADARAEGPIISSADVDEIDARLLSMLRNDMLKSGALTVNEFVDQVKHDKNNGGAEIDAAKKAHRE